MGTEVKRSFPEVVIFELCPEESVRFHQMNTHGVGSPRQESKNTVQVGGLGVCCTFGD